MLGQIALNLAGPAIVSAIIAVYNNEDYADDLYRSLDGQKLDPELFEIVLVDDGSTDRTLMMAREWQRRSKLNVRIVTKENGGVSSARNLGISHAQGEWIAFIDSDDILHKEYLNAIVEFIRRDSFRSASMLTTRSIIFNEEDGSTVDNHPLSWKYKRGDRLVSLALEPHVVHLAGHSSVVRRSVVLENDIKFDEKVLPGFEDANFNGRYLSHFDEPILGLVSSARYFYRKRANGSSLIDTTWTKPEKFTHEPKYGHLGLLAYVTKRLGYTPVWAQNTVLYAQYWYFSADRTWNSPITSVSQELLDEYWETLHEIIAYIDAQTIRSFSLRNFGWYMSEGILRQFKNQAWKSSAQYVVYKWGAPDRRRKIRKYVYSYRHQMPRETFYINGKLINAVYSKSIKHNVFGKHLMYERIIHLPTNGKISIFLDGEQVKVEELPKMNRIPSFRQDKATHLVLAPGREIQSPQQLAAQFYRHRGKALSRFAAGTIAFHSKVSELAWVRNQNLATAAFQLLSRMTVRIYSKWQLKRQLLRYTKHAAQLSSPELSEKYKDAWVFLDRPDRADDNAEHLYRYVRDQLPEINAWFILSENSRDWSRLQAEGFRLVAFGSEASISVTLRAKYILSSHADAGSYSPIDEKKYGVIKAKRIFLQHGMTKDDLSKWLNTKKLALMITCGVQERDSIVSDGSLYRLTRREVKLTGFPRHDSLVKFARAQVDQDRQLILVVPTWRKDLSNELQSAEDASQKRDVLRSSEFFIEWQRLTNSSLFLETVARSKLRVVFALHDHLAEFSDLFEFNDQVEIVPFSSMSVQNMVLNSRVVITDYSSMSTEAAIAGAAVIHYQFDADRIFDGSHSYLKGWMEYTRDGFGPVCESLPEFEALFGALEAANWIPDRKYADRLSKSLPVLDGSACSRVVREVLALESKELIIS